MNKSLVMIPFLLTAAQAHAAEWSAWRMSNEPFIEWRAITHRYNQNIAPDCGLEFRVMNGQKISFKYEAAFDPSAHGVPTPRKGIAYGITAREHGGDSINQCTRVSSVTVKKTRIDGSTAPTSGGANRANGASGAKPAFSRPTLEGVRLEPECIALLKKESERLKDAGAAKQLLAWAPLITLVGEGNAIHAAMSIGMTDWAEIAQGISAVDSLVLNSLAMEAQLHAESGAHHGNPSARAFWRAMAEFYASQARR
jgi:hypothetical protein